MAGNRSRRSAIPVVKYLLPVKSRAPLKGASAGRHKKSPPPAYRRRGDKGHGLRCGLSIRGHLQTVQEVSGALRMCARGEDGPLVIVQYLEP